MIRALIGIFGVGRVTGRDDAGDLQTLQITQGAIGEGFSDRILDKVKRFSQFGFGSVPPDDSDAIMLHRGGERSQSFVIATEHRPSRPKSMKPGDVVMYDVRGAKVQLTENGLLIDAAGLAVKVTNTSGVRVEGDISVTGDVTIQVDGHAISLAGFVTAYNAHKHSVSGSSTGTNDHTV